MPHGGVGVLDRPLYFRSVREMSTRFARVLGPNLACAASSLAWSTSHNVTSPPSATRRSATASRYRKRRGMSAVLSHFAQYAGVGSLMCKRNAACRSSSVSCRDLRPAP